MTDRLERGIYLDLERMTVEEGSREILAIAKGLGFTYESRLDDAEFLDEIVSEAIVWLNEHRDPADETCEWSIDNGSFGFWESVKCVSCDELIDVENGSTYYSEIKGGDVCEGCEQQDLEYGSTVYLVSSETGEKTKLLVGDLFVKEAEHFEEFGQSDGEPTVRRTYHHTDAWRGYNETTIEGYEEIKDLTGWTTGFADETVSRKHNLNAWLEEMVSDDECDSPVPFAIVFDPTSNVFSTAVSVHVKSGGLEEFKSWVNGQYDEISEALL